MKRKARKRQRDPEDIVQTWCNDCTFNQGKYECYDDDALVGCFWACWDTDNIELFDLEGNFIQVQARAQEKLAAHGLLGPEEFARWADEIGLTESDDINDYALVNPWIRITRDDLKDNMLEYVSERYREQFEDYGEFQNIKEIYDSNMRGLNTSEKVRLYDKAIHMQHVTGDVMHTDVESLRTQYEASTK